MPGKTRSFTLYDTANQFIDERAAATSLGHAKMDGAKNFSKVVDSALERYGSVLKQNVPKLSIEEWKIVLEALGGKKVETWAVASSVDLVIEFIEEHDEVDFDPDGKLKTKLKRLNYVKRIAMVDVIEKYWAALARGEEPKLPGE